MHTIDAVVDGLDAPSTIYRIKFLAVNEEGLKSEFSNELLFSLASLPSKPNAIRKDIYLSSRESIYVQWDKVIGDTLQVLGYKLYADSGTNDPLRLVYDGASNPQITEFSFEAESSLQETIDN